MTMIDPAYPAISCPLELKVARTLDALGIAYVHEPRIPKLRRRLDFLLIEDHVFIEVKRFHTPRSIAQLEHYENVILLQGEKAVDMFVALLTANVRKMEQERGYRGPLLQSHLKE